MMNSSTKPRSHIPRVSHTPHQSSISYPLVSSPNSHTPSLLTPSRPSISNTMHWLSRTSTQSSSSSPYTPSKPTRISEPKPFRSIELLSNSRIGALGSGATIVKTPDEALRETGVRLTYDGKSSSRSRSRSRDLMNKEETFTIDESRSTFDGKSSRPVREQLKPLLTDTSSEPETCEDSSQPCSPPLPPLPVHVEREVPGVQISPKKPTRIPPAPPTASLQSLRSSLKTRSEEYFDAPPLPSINIPASQIPPFNAILMSDVPKGEINPSNTIIILETCTQTYRTTMETLLSRPSNLSDYLSSLCPKSRDSDASSVYSTSSDDTGVYRRHLTSQGHASQSPLSVHLFIDRPSAPYAHILNYLRSPYGTLDFPELLPRAAQLHSSSQSRLEALLELRDEAAYLNLEGLHRLCTEELRLRQGPRLHTRGTSSNSINGSVHSLHASVCSLHTLVERVESDFKSDLRNSDSSEPRSKQESVISSDTTPITPPLTHKPKEASLRKKSQRNHSASVTPAGWI